jgi:outer membrane protein OmpA-like peptidoglycan-associated protein
VDYTVTQDDLDDGSNLVNLASVTTDEVTQAVEDTATSAVQYVDIEVIEEILEEDLIQTTTILSQGVSNISRRAADRLKTTKDHSCGEEINDLLTATPVQFATDKFFIDARNNALLDELTLILSECGNSSFMIAGHTDSDASDAYNLTLSQNRVDAVKAALVRRGIVGDRLQTRGFGESRPIATNATAEGKALNRRVEFILLDEVAPAGQKCGDDAQLTRNVDGSATDVGGSLNGNFASSGHNCVNGMYSETWGELSVTHDDDRGTVGVATFGMSREAQADGTLRGRFIEGYLSRNNVDSVDVSGAITGVGVHAGLYGAHATDAGLILSYYGSAAVGQHAFELNAGADVDGSYTHGAIFVGGAVGGVTEMAAMTVKPRLGIDLAYAAVIGSEISALSDTLDIDPVTVARGFVEIGFTQDVDNGTFSGAPRLFCEVNQDADACGFGAAFDYETLQNADGTLWSVGLDYEMIDNRQSASLKVAHAREIFDDLGVSRSSFGATATGALQAEQTIAFTW